MSASRNKPITPRKIALLRALKKRADRLERMTERKRNRHWSLARLARYYRLGPAQLRAQLAEYVLFEGEFNLLWRIHYQEVLHTLWPGDKGRYQEYCRAAKRYLGGEEATYTGPAKDATLREFAHRKLLGDTYRNRPKIWARL